MKRVELEIFMNLAERHGKVFKKFGTYKRPDATTVNPNTIVWCMVEQNHASNFPYHMPRIYGWVIAELEKYDDVVRVFVFEEDRHSPYLQLTFENRKPVKCLYKLLACDKAVREFILKITEFVGIELKENMQA